MPQILTVTQDSEESSDQFAARIAGEMKDFFGDSAESAGESAEPAEESPAETSTATDEG